MADLVERPTTLSVELPTTAWQQFPTGDLLGAEMRRLAGVEADTRGRTIKSMAGVITDKDRGAYVATFDLEP